MTKPRFHPLGFQREKLSALMQQRGLAAILLTSPENVFYTTGYTCLSNSGNPILYSLRNRLPFFSYVDREGEVTLLCWGFSAEGVDFGADRLIGFNSFGGALRAVSSLLQDQSQSGDIVGLESTCPSYVTNLVSHSVQVKSDFCADELVSRLRLIKSTREMEMIRKSTQVIEDVVSDLYGKVRVGMSRLELMREARAGMMREGADGIGHITFSFGDENPEIAIDEPLQENRLVTLDLGAIYGGYASDNRRYVYTGSVPSSLVNTYNTMVEIVDRVGEALQPGKSYAEIFQLALGLYEKHNIKLLERFTHVGHSIGIETEEEWLDDNPDACIQAGTVLNIELYTIAETGEQVGDEETYIIDESGPTRISVLPREIREV